MKSWPETIRLAQPVRAVSLRMASQAAAFSSAAPAFALSAPPPPAPAPVPAPASKAELQAAYEKGHADGEKALGEQLVRQRAELQELVDGVVASLRQAVPSVVRDTEQHLVALSLEIAQKLVGETPISVEMVEAVVRDALSQVEGTAEFHVRLHPADLELLQKFHSPLLAPAGEDQTLRFHSSPEVTRGGCLVQTRFGVVDARRETKLDLLKRSLLG